MSLKIEIIDDFLSIEDLKKLQSLDLGKTPDKKMNVYVKKIDEKNNTSGTGMEDDTALKLQQNYQTKMRLVNKMKKKENKRMNIYQIFSI